MSTTQLLKSIKRRAPLEEGELVNAKSSRDWRYHDGELASIDSDGWATVAWNDPDEPPESVPIYRIVKRLAEDEVKEGNKYDGIITSFTRQGAYVEIGAHRAVFVFARFLGTIAQQLRVDDGVTIHLARVDKDGKLWGSLTKSDAKKISTATLRKFEQAAESEEFFPAEVTHMLSSMGPELDVTLADGTIGACRLHMRNDDPGRAAEIQEGYQLSVRIMTPVPKFGAIHVSTRPRIRDNVRIEKRAKDWEQLEQYMGMWLDAKVVSIQTYGAFVRMQPPGVDFEADGFLHISKLQARRVDNVRSVINEGDMVRVRIVSLDVENFKMRVSMIDLHDWQ